MGKGRIHESVGIHGNSRGSTGCRRTRPECRFQNQGIFLCLGIQIFTKPTILAMIVDSLVIGGVQVQEIGAYRAKAHSCTGGRKKGLRSQFLGRTHQTFLGFFFRRSCTRIHCKFLCLRSRPCAQIVNPRFETPPPCIEMHRGEFAIICVP